MALRPSKKKDLIFSAVILLLVCALAVCSILLVKKGNRVQKVSASLEGRNADLASAQSELETYRSQTEEYSSQIEEDRQKQNELQAQLDEAQKEKERLQKENAELNRQLLAKRKAAEEAARLVESKSAQPPQTPVPPTGSKVCYLTFDDGPTANTLKILDILARYRVKATFFVIGTSGHPEYMKNIVDGGHAIALHSFTHNYATIYRSPEAYFADLQAISNTVEQYTGVKTTLIRFPGGGSNTVSKKYCNGIMSKLATQVTQSGYSYFDWNVSSGDAESNRPAASKILNNVLTYSRNKDAVCVLMHDAAAKTTTVEALPGIIEGLSGMGFRFEALTPESYGFHQRVQN